MSLQLLELKILFLVKLIAKTVQNYKNLFIVYSRMSKMSHKKQLSWESTLDHLNHEGSFLKIFFYLTQTQRKKIEYLFHFLQKYKLKLGFLTKEKRFHLSHYFQGNANFIAQSIQPISQSDFATISFFLSSQVIIVSFFYQDQIWTVSRFLKWHKTLSQSFLVEQEFKQVKVCETNVYLIKSKRNQFLRLWLFFNQMIF